MPVLQAVTAIVHIAEARQLATLCDGALQLLDQESLEGKLVPGLKVCSSWPRASRMSSCVSVDPLLHSALSAWSVAAEEPASQTQAGSADATPGRVAAHQGRCAARH